MSGRNRTTSEKEQAEIDAELDAALDALSDDEEEVEDLRSPDLSTANAHLDDTAPSVPSVSPSTVENAEAPKVSTTTAATTTTTNAAARPVMGPPRPPPEAQTQSTATASAMMGMMEGAAALGTDDEEELKAMNEMMQQLLSQAPQEMGAGPEAFFGQLLQEMQTQIQGELQQEAAATEPEKAETTSTNNTTRATSRQKSSPASEKKSPAAKAKKKQPPEPSTTGEEVNRAVSALLEDMEKSTVPDQQSNVMDSIGEGASDEQMLKNLAESLGQMGEDWNGDASGDADALLDGMMEQLLSKDLMYEPMKQVAAKFPDWLKERRKVLSEEDYSKRCSQFECFQQLVRAYETEPNNTAKLASLMQAVQEYGQPPPEIIRDIAPGLELDEDGLPKFDPSDLPFPGTDEECRIM